MSAGIWTSRLSMPSPSRFGCYGSNIGSQKAYCFYGDSVAGAGGKILDCDEYDNVGDFWTAKVDGPAPTRDEHDATVIGADKAYCFCGKDDASVRLTDNDEYSQSGNSWTSKTGCSFAKESTGAVTVGGKAYSFGGLLNYKKIEEYSQSGDSWTTKTDIGGTDRFASAAFALNSEAYWICGNGTTEVESYAPASDVWTTRNSAGALNLDYLDGSIIGLKGYITGGAVGATAQIQTLEHTPSTDSWAAQTDVPSARFTHTSSPLGSSNFYCFGGKSDATTIIDSVDEFHMPTSPWIENLSPAHEETDVAEDANITFDVLDNNGVDTATLNVTINGVPVITAGAFQTGYNGTIVEIT